MLSYGHMRVRHFGALLIIQGNEYRWFDGKLTHPFIGFVGCYGIYFY